MFKLINQTHKEEIIRLIQRVKNSDLSEIVGGLVTIINRIRSDIPKKKRISYGRYSIIKDMGHVMYPLLNERGVNIPGLALRIFIDSMHDQFVRSLAVQLFSIYGEMSGELENVLPLFEKAASDTQWEIRECSAGFIRKLVTRYPEALHKWYLTMVTSEDPMQRRFASESLRLVADNEWLIKNPRFSFSILEHLYKESERYPRTSIGNNLSDWMRIDKAKTLKIVKQLANNGDKNSYWIAYRACRNLVKKEPLLVMDLLKTDKYLYKDRKFYRDNYR